MKTLDTNYFGNIVKALTLSAVFALTACGGSSGGDGNNNGGGKNVTPPAPVETTVTSLNQAAWVSGTTSYQYAHNSIPNIKLDKAPDDVDYKRYAMLHDGTTYRLYFFKKGTNDTLYQFGFNVNTLKYEYGFNSIPVLQLTGIPGDADTSSFAMLHDGIDYRLYMKSLSSDTTMYQFAYNSSSRNYEFGYRSISVLFLTMAPADTDFSRWAMLHDGSAYRFYAGKMGTTDIMYQFAFNRASNDYEYGYNSIPTLTVKDMPDSSITDEFAMLHDGRDYRFYHTSTLE